jgi:hypothetical protein
LYNFDVESREEKKGAMGMGKRYLTAVAQEAMDIGDHLLLLFSKKTCGENPRMRVDVAKPDGPSTEGGKKSRQTISLVPVEGTSGKVMVGWLDVALKRVEVRSFRVVRFQYYNRYGTDFKVPHSEYEKVVQELSIFLRARGFDVVVKDDTPAGRLSAPQHQAASATVAAPNNGGGIPWIWIAVSLLIGAGGIALGAMLF